MSILKRCMLCSLLLITSAVMARTPDNTVRLLQKSLKPWQPTAITQAEKALTIVLPEKSIPSEAYEALATSGICSPIWTKDVPASFLKNITEINIVNQFKATGYTFENPAASCSEMGKLMDEPAKALLLSKTRLFKPAK